MIVRNLHINKFSLYSTVNVISNNTNSETQHHHHYVDQYQYHFIKHASFFIEKKYKIQSFLAIALFFGIAISNTQSFYLKC